MRQVKVSVGGDYPPAILTIPLNPETGDEFETTKVFWLWVLNHYNSFFGARQDVFAKLLEKVAPLKLTRAYWELKNELVESVKKDQGEDDRIALAAREFYGHYYVLGAFACGYQDLPHEKVYPWAHWTLKDELNVARFCFFRRVVKERKESQQKQGVA